MSTYHDEKYIELVNYILAHGTLKPNRTGVDALGVFSYQMRFDLRDRTIPLLTTKKVHTKSIIHELLWMLSGSSNIKYLNDNGVTIWDEWADKDGELGPVYGVQWRAWQKYNWVLGGGSGSVWEPDHYEVGLVDQIAQVVDKLMSNPLDRRLIVSAWNVAELDQMRLPPCHYTFQFYARPLTTHERLFPITQTYYIPGDVTSEEVEQLLDKDNVPSYELSLMLNQRSCDVGLGVPFNIVQYSLLLRMFCEVVNMYPGEFIWNGGDVHIYTNHIDALTEQTKRFLYPSPQFYFARNVQSIDDFKYEDFIFEDYTSHPAIKMEVAV